MPSIAHHLAGAFACVLAVLQALTAPAWAQGQSSANAPVATVNGVAIKPALFQAALQQAVNAGQPDSAQLREAIRAQLIARELFIQAAAKQGLDKDAEVLAIAEEAKRSAMVQRYLRQTLKPTPVTEEQVRARYEQMKAGLGAREYKLRVMLLPNEQRAKELHQQLLKGADFAQTARKWSLAPTAVRGGELEWVSFKSPAEEGATGWLPLPIAQAAEKLRKGMVSDVIPIQGKYWLVRLDDTRPTKVPTFAEAKQGIYNMLVAQELERATSELVNRLAQGARITP